MNTNTSQIRSQNRTPRSGLRRSARLVAAASAATVTMSILGFASPASAGPGCGSVIQASTTLTENLLNCPGSGLVVNASNVVLDLGGHTVDGSGSLGSAGISVAPGKTGVTIRNGIVRQFDMGVYLQFGSSGSLVSGLTVSQNKTGLYGAQLSDNNRIRSNRFTQNSGDGAFLMGSAHLVGNDADHNGRHGVTLLASSRVTSNRLYDNAVDGLHVNATAPSQVEFNKADGNDDDGIDVDTVSGTTLRGNSATLNLDHGIVALPLNTDAGGNTASGNGNANCVNVACP